MIRSQNGNILPSVSGYHGNRSEMKLILYISKEADRNKEISEKTSFVAVISKISRNQSYSDKRYTVYHNRQFVSLIFPTEKTVYPALSYDNFEV